MTSVPRTPTSPGGFTLDPDEELTPVEGRPDAGAVLLTRIYLQLSAPDRQRAVQLLTNWAGCTLDRRVLIEAMARELAGT
jgi:hypothetical protein